MEKIKKLKIWSVFVIFGLTFLLHFAFDLLPNPLLAIFTPVNESIWEHMKLILTSYVLWSTFEYFYLTKHNIRGKNFFFQAGIAPIAAISLYILLYLPLYRILGDNMVASIGLLFVIICLEALFSYYLMLNPPMFNGRVVGIVSVLGMYVLFTIFTYNPIKNHVFYDTKHNGYGIINKG